MKDNKKFWLITLVYLFIFWILPVLFFNYFLGFLEKILRLFNLKSSAFNLYFFIVVPLIFIIIYILLIEKIKLKFKNTFFVIFYILIPYTIGIFYFLYALAHIDINFIG